MNRYRIMLSLAAVLVLFDQATKWLVLKELPLGTAVPVTSFFSLVHVQNRGAAFGFLNDPNISWQFWLFFAASLMASAIVLWIAKTAKAHETMLFWALGSILGGAIGNLIDRVRFRAVIDFLDFYINTWHWPAFNVADIAICLGAIALMLHSLRPDADAQKRKTP